MCKDLNGPGTFNRRFQESTRFPLTYPIPIQYDKCNGCEKVCENIFGKGGNFVVKSYGIAMGGKIYSLRVAKRMTQEQLAQELCISPAAVSKWERNQAIPGIEMLWALADFFDCTIDELVGRKEALLERVGVYDSEKIKLITIAEELLKCMEISIREGLLAMEEEMSIHYQGRSRFLPFAVGFMHQCCYKQM